MRSVILWLLWMLYWIILAAGTPSFFPSWVQSFIYGFGLGSSIFGCAYAYHVSLLRDDIKRLETKNTDLEKQLQKEPAALTQISPGHVNVVEVTEVIDTQHSQPFPSSVSFVAEGNTKSDKVAPAKVPAAIKQSSQHKNLDSLNLVELTIKAKQAVEDVREMLSRRSQMPTGFVLSRLLESTTDRFNHGLYGGITPKELREKQEKWQIQEDAWKARLLDEYQESFAPELENLKNKLVEKGSLSKKLLERLDYKKTESSSDIEAIVADLADLAAQAEALD